MADILADLIKQVNHLQYIVDGLVKPEIPLASGSRPQFSAFVSGTSANVTGDGTIYTVIFDNEIFDIAGNYNAGTGVFTAPYTGKYLLIGNVLCQDCGVAHTGGWINMVTSNRTYSAGYTNPGASAYAGYRGFHVATIADMDASDTAYVSIFVTGGTKVVDVYGQNVHSYFQGYYLP